MCHGEGYNLDHYVTKTLLILSPMNLDLHWSAQLGQGLLSVSCSLVESS